LAGKDSWPRKLPSPFGHCTVVFAAKYPGRHVNSPKKVACTLCHVDESLCPAEQYTARRTRVAERPREGYVIAAEKRSKKQTNKPEQLTLFP